MVVFSESDHCSSRVFFPIRQKGMKRGETRIPGLAPEREQMRIACCMLDIDLILPYATSRRDKSYFNKAT